jgi:hypothetical protein
MEAIADALEKTRWCRKDAAKMLGISYKALLYKIRQFGLDADRGTTGSPKEAPKGKESVDSDPPPISLAPAGRNR